MSPAVLLRVSVELRERYRLPHEESRSVGEGYSQQVSGTEGQSTCHIAVVNSPEDRHHCR